MQQWYLDLPGHGLIRLWNVYYGIAHFLVTFVALVWLFRRDPHRHRLLRNTLALTTALAVIGFAAYSLMPPRLLDDPGEYGACQIYAPEAAAAAAARRSDRARAATSTATSTPSPRYGGWISFGNEGMKDVSNQYAAMPSMHIGWSTWSAIVLVPLRPAPLGQGARRRLPVHHAGVHRVTANHYWIDGVGGLVCLGAGYGLRGRSPVARPRSPSPS